ncbi:MAG: hypothetical protein EZS28_051793, partial [Streblomastix strix]
DQIKVEEAEAKRIAILQKKKKKKKKGEKGQGWIEYEDDEENEDQKEEIKPPPDLKGKKKKKKKEVAEEVQQQAKPGKKVVAKEPPKEKILTADAVKQSLDEELKKNHAAREKILKECNLLRIESEVYISKISELIDTSYPEPVIEDKSKQKKKKKKKKDEEEEEEQPEDGAEEEQAEEEQQEEEEEGEGLDESGQGGQDLDGNVNVGVKRSKKDLIRGGIKNGQYIPLPGQGILKRSQTELDAAAEAVKDRATNNLKKVSSKLIAGATQQQQLP